MITYEDNGMYSVFVRDGSYKIGEILSYEGRIWWYKPHNGMPKTHMNSLDAVKYAIESGEYE